MLSSSTRAILRPQLKRIAQSIGDKQQQICRIQKARFSVEPTFSSYEYPTRTEAPEITTTKASEAVGATNTIVNGTNKIYTQEDPFDDSGSLSDADQERLKEEQSDTIGNIKLSSLPITTTVPDFIPPNVSSGELEAPETLITTLDNGIRVVSQETYSQMCTIGVLTNVGSRHESVAGTMHLLETMAFGSTEKYEGQEIAQILQDWGATRFVSHSREQSLHCIDVLRPNVNNAMELLSQVVLEPLITKSPMEVEYAKEVMAFQTQEQVPELALGEGLQVAAYGSDQQLGKPHFATAESIPLLNAAQVEDFYLNNIRSNPEGMVVAGAGIAHDELVDMAKEYFSGMEQKTAPITQPSVYRGGNQIVEKPATESVYQQMLPEEEQCRIALAFPVGGWHSDNMVTACVLQTLLGGGSSFSAGGPGKGMYSRMYQQVLNRYGWMEAAEAFTTFADEGGLFGVSASTPIANKVPELVTILADQLASVAIQPVGEVELSRARNMLKCNVLTQLESRLILFEDMGRQVLTYGKREDAATTCKKIESVTAQDIQRLAQDMLTNYPPTLVATGSHLERVPDYNEVSRWFR
eukprot:CAMPEP_0116125560 /NCGR_PEP_ID=MMETSP0329-20121206/5872_1 /TAXON_ID=697910 /ORGANISM="Pseudo-nitzschia arenysensis, Strain B593" /LENGTH=580 /DNA_ID=CAMNT_0003619601 /DNA_START=65 /DNA_END=1807 /DNA_ORIENTATION=-